MTLNAVFQDFFSYIMAASAPIHAFLEIFFSQYSLQYSFQATGCFPKYSSSKQWTAMRDE